jgi:hypothetical protein
MGRVADEVIDRLASDAMQWAFEQAAAKNNAAVSVAAAVFTFAKGQILSAPKASEKQLAHEETHIKQQQAHSRQQSAIIKDVQETIAVQSTSRATTSAEKLVEFSASTVKAYQEKQQSDFSKSQGQFFGVMFDHAAKDATKPFKPGGEPNAEVKKEEADKSKKNDPKKPR